MNMGQSSLIERTWKAIEIAEFAGTNNIIITCQGRELDINFSSEAHTTKSTEWPEPYTCTRSNIARAAMDSCLVPIRARQHSIAQGKKSQF